MKYQILFSLKNSEKVCINVVFAKPEDFETWEKHLSFRFLIRIRSSPCSLSSGCLDLSVNLLTGNMVLVQSVQ